MTAKQTPAKAFPKTGNEATAQDILQGDFNASTNQRGAIEGSTITEAVSSYAGNRAMAHAKVEEGVTHDLSPKPNRAPGQFDADAIKQAEKLLARNGGKPLTADRVFRRI
jgi:hypothetical protein